jgi:hypothetical protein
MFATDPMGLVPGDPPNGASAIFDVIKREGIAAGRPWAVRVVLGSDALDSATQRHQQELKLLENWQTVSYRTDGRSYVARKDLLKFTAVPGLEE